MTGNNREVAVDDNWLSESELSQTCRDFIDSDDVFSRISRVRNDFFYILPLSLSTIDDS